MLLTLYKHGAMICLTKRIGTGTVPFFLQTGFEHEKIYQPQKGYYYEKSD